MSPFCAAGPSGRRPTPATAARPASEVATVTWDQVIDRIAL
ncbi:MAG TPA: hypothetical protein VGI05_05775 [Streptosporangiaceae bacterium]